MANHGPAAETKLTVKVRPVTVAERPLIEALAQFYIYDFSELEPPGSRGLVFDDTGRFAPLPGLDDHWRDEGSHAYLIQVHERPAGFALINRRSHQGGAVERNMGEFFVARKYRRTGVASHAVRDIVGRLPGRWEVAVAERNVAAQSFWPAALRGAPNVSDMRRLEGDGRRWRGPIWTFVADAHSV